MVEDISVRENSGGVYSILMDFYNEVKDSGSENQWIFLLGERLFPDSENIKVKIFPRKWSYRFGFSFLFGRRVINDFSPDIYISLQNIATLGVNASKQFLYVHQAIPFQRVKKFSFFQKSERKLAGYQYLVGACIFLSIKLSPANVIVQTQWMKEEICRRHLKRPERVKVISPTDLVQSYIPEKIQENRLQQRTFFFPATNFPYKNHRVIIDAVRILNQESLPKFSVVFTLSPSVKPVNTPKNVQYIGMVPREKVMTLYQESVLVFPSYIETYGLPLLEAKNTGAFVFSGDTPFGHEVLSEYPNAYYFDCFDANSLADLMRSFLKGKLKYTPFSVEATKVLQGPTLVQYMLS
ncbi:glycosyltransferase [Lacticaseibacillus paracasei]|uniref:glycosyltransferase n=1 Tax=Lacticaseibacillus paracasei TaxID=1597 RepID=UPI001F0312B3|nr:glycosyltransferase [Lacticaseibacillus paracasei]